MSMRKQYQKTRRAAQRRRVILVDAMPANNQQIIGTPDSDIETAEPSGITTK